MNTKLVIRNILYKRYRKTLKKNVKMVIVESGMKKVLCVWFISVSVEIEIGISTFFCSEPDIYKEVACKLLLQMFAGTACYVGCWSHSTVTVYSTAYNSHSFWFATLPLTPYTPRSTVIIRRICSL